MEVERQNLAEAVTLAERKHSDEKKRVDELQQQVKVLKSSLDSSKQELADYKQKATRILQVSLRRTCMNVEAQVPFLRWKDPLEKAMAPHSRTLAWKIPWTEGPGGTQSTGSQRVRHS